MTSYLRDLRPCKCGNTPVYAKSQHGATRALQLKCACGETGAFLTYTKPEDEERMRQAGIDGWNLADQSPSAVSPRQPECS